MHRLLLWVQGELVPGLGPAGLFLVALVDSSVLSLPEINDVLMASTGAAHPGRLWLSVAVTTLGSLAGCSALWWAGRRGGEPLLRRRFGADQMQRAHGAFRRSQILALALPALLPPPMPFKVFVVAAGVFGLPYRRFALTLLVARGARYAFWGTMGAVHGEKALRLLRTVDAWFAERLPLALLATALGLLVALLALAWRRRARLRASAA